MLEMALFYWPESVMSREGIEPSTRRLRVHQSFRMIGLKDGAVQIVRHTEEAPPGVPSQSIAIAVTVVTPVLLRWFFSSWVFQSTRLPS